MAAGTITVFNYALLEAFKGSHNLSSNTIKLGIITSAMTPSVSDVQPHWGGTGTTDYSTAQVATGSTYVTGGPALTTVTWALVGGIPTLQADSPIIAVNAGGFTNGRWGILYNSTDASKRALAFVDFGADKSIVAIALKIQFAAGGIFDLANV
jgi:hypothetical protein